MISADELRFLQGQIERDDLIPSVRRIRSLVGDLQATHRIIQLMQERADGFSEEAGRHVYQALPPEWRAVARGEA